MRREWRKAVNQEARALLYGDAVETWSEAVAAADEAFRCTARAKSTGLQCRARPVLGKRVCKIHGGATPPRTPEQKEKHRQFMNAPEIITVWRARVAKQPRVRGRWAKMEAAK